MSNFDHSKDDICEALEIDKEKYLEKYNNLVLEKGIKYSEQVAKLFKTFSKIELAYFALNEIWKRNILENKIAEINKMFE